MRWLHVVSAIVLLGGLAYARLVIGDLDARFKPLAYWAIGGILVSGTYNYVSKTAYPPHYHAWLGLKVLLALHIFVNVFLYRGKVRLLTGFLIVGGAIVGLAEYLRCISTT